MKRKSCKSGVSLSFSLFKKFRRRVQESTKVLRELEISLRTNHIGWVREFLNDENKGLDVLVEYLSFAQCAVMFDFENLENGEDGVLDKAKSWSRSIEDLHQSSAQAFSSSSLARSARQSVLRYNTLSNSKTIKNSRLVSQKDDVHVCIMCLRAVMNYQYGFNLVMSHPHAVNEIALSLNNKNSRTKALVLELLAAVCLVRGGHEIILSAFDNFKEVCKEKHRFEKLMEYFRSEEGNIDFMVACMQFINIVVHSVEDMNFRVHLQYEFTKLGLDDFLEKSRHTESDKLSVQIQAYLDNVFDVGGLLEDAETKNVALEKVEELEEHLSHLNEKLLDVENENMTRVAELEKQLLHKDKELEAVKFPPGPDECPLRSSPRRFDLKALPVDFVECLMRCLPTEAEVKVLRQYERERRPLDQLAEEDRFMLLFSKIERLTQRMSIITFVGNFQDNLSMLTPQLNAIIAASASMKSSPKLKRMLEIILALGNYMNSSKRGAVYGFKLQSLDLLLDTKSTDRKMTLLHYIALIVKEKYPELSTFGSELHFIDKAAAVSLENVLLDVREQGRGMDLVRRECSLHDHAVLKAFVSSSEAQLEKLQRDAKTAEEAFNIVVQYFGENAKTTPPSAFFPVFVRFVRAYKEAEQDNELRKKQEAAMREKLLAQEAKQQDQKTQAQKTKRQQQQDLIAELRRRQAKDHRPVYEGKDGTLEDIITVLKSVPFTARTAKRGSRFFCDANLYDESNC
nr:PREDICTED: formin-like protein 3 [Lepisosteus oculatus]